MAAPLFESCLYYRTDTSDNPDRKHDAIMSARPKKQRQPKTTNREQAEKRSPATPRAARDVRTPGAARPARPERAKTVDPARLNPAQREAVRTLQGPVLVIAGAGTGKTLTLVQRLAELVRSVAVTTNVND